MKTSRIIFAALSVMLSAVAYGQQITVTGNVTDASDGTGVPYASVHLKGTMTGVSADPQGSYSITVPSDGVLVFSSIGYLTIERQVAGQKTLSVALEPDAQMLDETIVVAFGTSTKESFTGSAAVVGESEIARVQSSDVTRALDGVVAGVQMTTSTGTLGSSPSIRIRGIGTISGSVDKEPLFVVDGVPFSGDLNNLNPSDIESMTVLKDAASNALYGARGANGVIMITTKKAKGRGATVTLDAKLGWNTKALRSYETISDPAQYYEMHYKALYNYYVDKQGMSQADAGTLASERVAGPVRGGGLGYQVFTVPQGEAFIGPDGKVNPRAVLGNVVNHNGKDYLLIPDDWMKEAYRQSLRQEYNLSVAGGVDKASFLASFGYLNNKGIIDGADMYRYTARLKADFQAKEWLKVGANVSYTNYDYNNGNGEEGSAGSVGNVFGFAASMAPIYPVYIRDASGNIMTDSRGLLMYDFGDGKNAGMVRPNAPNANALRLITLDRNISEGNAFTGTAYAEVKFLRDFKFTFNVGTGVDGVRHTSMNNMYYGQFATNGGTLYKEHERRFYVNLQQLLNYNRTFAGVHNVDVLLGHETYSRNTETVSAYKTNMFSIDNLELGGAVIDGQQAGSSRTEYNNEGYFIRAQYDYADRVFVSGSYRRDASSRFHKDRRWGDFWSAGAGWVINHEPWFKAYWVDLLKLKASIGSQGNDGIPDYLYVDTYEISNNEGDVAVAFRTKGNPDITWETNLNFNTGVDFELFSGRIRGSVEYFYRKTKDMLFFFNVPLSLGYSGYYDNIGDMRNSGIEVAVDAVLLQRKNVVWDVNANLTHYTNKITMLPEEHKKMEVEGFRGYQSGGRYYGEGLPIYTFYMPKYAGVEVDTGLPMWYQEKNGERVTTTVYSDATDYLCGDPTPDIYGGFGTSVSFYGFDASVQFTYSVGGLTYDSGYAALMTPPGSSTGSNIHKNMLQAWTPDDTDSSIPRFQYLDENIAAQSDRFLTDASYLNFQSAQIGYTLPRKITDKFKVSRLRVYVLCDNIFYWSSRQGLDPRYSFTGTTNYAVNSPVRTLSGGVNITF
ncbi:MAG: TonB-dependent receptor [Bacteroidales bacterium]|nr:TonB-dependent receptor [Bacteroidales bacterium]